MTDLHAALMCGLGMLAVFSIVGMLHTGQPLAFTRATRIAALLLVAAVALRVLPDLGLMPQPPPYAVAALPWASGFLLWFKVYWPALRALPHSPCASADHTGKSRVAGRVWRAFADYR